MKNAGALRENCMMAWARISRSPKSCCRDLSKEHSTESKEQLLADVIRVMDGALQQIRSVSYLLHPPLLDEIGLRSALGWYLDGLSKRGDIEIGMDCSRRTFRGSRRN